MTTYPYTVNTDGTFPNRKVDLDSLATQVRAASGISVALDTVTVSGGNCLFAFRADLTSAEILALEAVIAAHTGEPVLPNIQAVEMYSGSAPAPLAADGKPFVLPNSFPGEVLLNFTGINDKLSPPERFGGTLFGLQKTGVGSETFTIDFLDGVFLAGGHIEWDGGSWGSEVYMELTVPATTVKDPVVANHGNCNLVPTGLGFNIIVPAAGNGTKDLDVPIPVPANDGETNAQNGYWSYSEPWLGKGTVSPAVPGYGKYNLFDIPLELAHFAEIHVFKDSGARDMIAPAIKPKWILPEWKITVTLINAGSGTLRLAWDLMIARRSTQ
jgi:hypothetical protein